MEPGEQLWNAVWEAKSRIEKTSDTYPFNQLSDVWKQAHAEVEARVLDQLRTEPATAMHSITPALLQRYGRHDPRCDSSGPCTCGFAEVEKQWFSSKT